MTASPPVIHIVEDDASVLKGLSRLLRAWGYEVRASDGARHFLDGLDGGPVACVIVDVHMPGLTGLQLQSALKRAGRPIPMVFVTGHGDASSQREALAEGAVAFLKKPFTDRELLAAIDQALAQEPA